jgi:octaprenyl-diphosphate synthase
MSATTLLAPTLSAPVPDLLSPIAADLAEVERVLSRWLENKNPRLAPVLDHVRLFRGKRLRPILLLLTARACGRVVPAHHTLGAVVEMIHTATLVHDDILDGATTRRKAATVNSVWGVQPAVLLGDYLFTRAFHLAATVGDARACERIGAATDRVCEGELAQILNKGNLDLTEVEYFDIIDGKTAELTACCCDLGALYAGMDTPVVDAMSRYGRYLGQAFQVADDLLDLVGDEAKVGKSLGTDVDQGKMTLPLLHLLRSSQTDLALKGRKLLANGGTREQLRPLLEEAGSLAYARRVALDLVARAQSELLELPPSPARSILELMAQKAVQREV